MLKICDTTIPGIPLSVNRMYTRLPNRRKAVLTKEGKAWKNRVQLSIQEVIPLDLLLDRHNQLLGMFIFKGSFITKKNEARIRDLDDLLKSVVDGVFNGLNVNDCTLFDLLAFKRNSQEETTRVILYSLDSMEMEVDPYEIYGSIFKRDGYLLTKSKESG